MINIQLSEEDRKAVLDLFERVQAKYDLMAVKAIESGKNDAESYYNGVVDGINHCFKIITGVEDDYLDGV